MLTFSSHLDGYYDVSDQMIDDLRRRAETLLQRQYEEKANLKTVAEFEAYRQRVRESFFNHIGGLPTERTPLEPQITGTCDRGNYRVEKLLYQSLPDFYVSAALYVPHGITAPVPAVVFVHGHSDAGKGYERYQQVCIDLVENGFVVMAIDPLGQGERFQFFDPVTEHRLIYGCTTEHTHAGLPYFLKGASIARHFIWDVVRGIDYLETRPEVDATRIGLTGNSGGGTQTSLLLMSEPRIAAAVPCTFITTLETYMRVGQIQDAEQLVPGCMVYGPDHDDFLTAIAPRPVLVGAVAYDFFPIEGAIEAVERAKKVYALYEAADHVDIAIASTVHQYAPGIREACVNWFRRHLQKTEPNFRTSQPPVVPENEMWATPKGQIQLAYPAAKTAFDLQQNLLATPRPVLDVAQLRTTIAQVLGVETEKRARPIYPRIIADTVFEGYRTEKIFFFSDARICTAGILIHPRTTAEVKRTTLLLLENGTTDIPAQRAKIETLLRRNQNVFVYDVRGTGAVVTRAVNTDGIANGRTELKLASDAMMQNTSTLGLRVFDVLRGYDYLKSRDDVQEIGIYGVGNGAFYAAFAGALEEGMNAITCEDLLYSYEHLCETRYYNRQLYNFNVMAWGILQHFDLPDLMLCLTPRPTTFIHPRNAYGEILSGEEFSQKFTATVGELPYGWQPEYV